jgi:predicted transcriptional regulator YdeE
MTTNLRKKDTKIKYRFADLKEAQKLYLSNTDYLNNFSQYDLDYKMNKKNATLEEFKAFGVSQMLEFTDKEKKLISKQIAKMEKTLEIQKMSLPFNEEIIFIKSTQKEENGSLAYTHGTQIYFAEKFIDNLEETNIRKKFLVDRVFWHELFHCLTRANKIFRKDMYKIIHFTVTEKDFIIPKSIFDISISNPDVEHHDSYATFNINGKNIDCYMVLTASKPFNKPGDSFFHCIQTCIVPIDSKSEFYLPENATNFWEIFGKNTNYVIDPEECLADNFSYAMLNNEYEKYIGIKMKELNFKNPEIIEKIINYLKN